MENALYLLPVTLGDTEIDNVLPSYNREIIRQIKFFIVENVRSARRFLKKVDRDINIDELTFYLMDKHTDAAKMASYLKPLEEGNAMGVISEAGCPAVADPGMSVMGSGFNGQSFAFNGYLPIEPAERTKRIKQLETRAYTEDQTQLFIETPYRNHKMLEELLRTCKPSTRLCIASGITCAEEYIHTHTIAEWKKIKLHDLSKIPTIFLIYKG